MRHTVLMGLLVGLGCHGGVNGADPSNTPAPSDPAGATRPTDGVTPPPAEPAPAPASFASKIADLDPDESASVTAAAERFVEHFGDTKHPEAELKAGIDQMLALAVTAAAGADARIQDDGDLNAAACASTGRCDSGPVTPQAKAELEALRESGIRVVYEGEGTVVAAPDEAAIADMLGAVLSAPAKAYLDALHWQAGRIDGQYDEDGFGGDPADVAAGLAKWEALAKADPAYADVAEARAASVASQYLRMCDHREFTRPACVVDKKLRKAYEAFPTTNPDSAYRDAVAAFLAEAKAQRYRLKAEQLDAAVEASLAAP